MISSFTLRSQSSVNCESWFLCQFNFTSEVSTSYGCISSHMWFDEWNAAIMSKLFVVRSSNTVETLQRKLRYQFSSTRVSSHTGGTIDTHTSFHSTPFLLSEVDQWRSSTPPLASGAHHFATTVRHIIIFFSNFNKPVSAWHFWRGISPRVSHFVCHRYGCGELYIFH